MAEFQMLLSRRSQKCFKHTKCGETLVICFFRIPFIHLVDPTRNNGSDHGLKDPAHGGRLKSQSGANGFPALHKNASGFLYTFSKCSFDKSFESRVMPKNFVDFFTSISAPTTFRGLLNDQFPLLVNITKCVLSWLSFSPFIVHHWLMLTRFFCVTSLKVSASKSCLPLGFLCVVRRQY